jgi:hypothetical protein
VIKRTASPLTPALSPLRGEGVARSGMVKLDADLRVHDSRNSVGCVSVPYGEMVAARTASPLTPALSPLRGEGVAKGGVVKLDADLRAHDSRNSAGCVSVPDGEMVAARTASPLTPALSPLRGEGVAAGAR